MKQRFLFIVLGFFMLSGCDLGGSTFTNQTQKTEPVSMPDEAFSRLRIRTNGPVNIKFVDNASATADPYAQVEIGVSIVGFSTDDEEINVDDIMQQAIETYADKLQLNFSVVDDRCTVTVDFDVPDSMVEQVSYGTYYYLYPSVTLVLVNMRAMKIDAQTSGKIIAETELTGAILSSSNNSITGDRLDNSTISAQGSISLGSAKNVTITTADSVKAEKLEQVTIQAKNIEATETDNITIVATGKVAIGTADAGLSVMTSGGAITVDEFIGAWLKLRQITNTGAYSSAGDISIHIAGDGVLNGDIKTDSGDVEINMLDSLSCIVDLTATKGAVDIEGVEYYMIKNDNNPDDWARFTLNAGAGALTVSTDTGDINVKVADMFFPD